ncbi:hypothetical protein SAMN05192575_11633 [Nocardioides alpinus]|jgi:hypothetical protein|uniref:Uncharacterized protein n=1 Tax=Nocardioides alpinus TaxID=748909 RepID=A0A1I1BH33_9ACTN|nr:hypothetical protein SAMN05192575_11633 [Nocardioides alpinus]
MSYRWTIPPEWDPPNGETDWYPDAVNAAAGAHIVLGEN